MPRYREWDRDLDQEYTRVRVKKSQSGRRNQAVFDDEDRDQRDYFRQTPRKNNDQHRRSARD